MCVCVCVEECRRRRRHHHAVLKINPLNSHPIIFAYTHSVLCFTTCCLLYLRFLDIKRRLCELFFFFFFFASHNFTCTVYTMFLFRRSCNLALVFRILAYLMNFFFLSLILSEPMTLCFFLLLLALLLVLPSI